MTGGARRVFRAVTLSCVMLSRWVSDVPPLAKPMECKTRRVNPNVNYGFS